MTTSTLTSTDTLEHKIDALATKVDYLTSETSLERRRRERLEELLTDTMPLARQATAELAEKLEELESRGYLDFAKASLGVADEIVTNFSAEDVRQLGENIVVILEVVKEMTQPEVMALLHHMIEAVMQQQAAIDEPIDPPSLWQLAMKARRPEVRRGLDRALSTLAAVSEIEPGTTPTESAPKPSTAGGV